MKFSTVEDNNKSFRMPTWLYAVLGTLMAVIFIVCSLQITFNIVYVYYPVTGTSMKPTINPEWSKEGDVADGVYVNVFNKGQRGDIIVVEKMAYDEKTGKWSDVIKRLIATGGDKVAICPVAEDSSIYKVLVRYKGKDDVTVLDELYLPEELRFVDNGTAYSKLHRDYYYSHPEQFEVIGGVKYLVVPEGHVFYMGDNRKTSKDCSEYGPVHESRIIGKVDIIIKNCTDFMPQILAFFGQQIVNLFI